MAKIGLGIQFEELVEAHPEAVGFLIRHGVRCIRCGDPVWGTLGELLKDANVEDPSALLDELRAYLQKQKKKY